MPVDIGTGVNFDVGPALAALDKLGGARDTLAGEFAKSNAAISQSFGPIIQSIGDVATESRAAATAQRQFAGDIAGLVKEIRDQAAAQREAQRASSEAAAERRKASAEARAAAKAEKDASKEVAVAAKEAAAAERLRAKEAAAANAESEKAGGFFSSLISKITGAKSGGEFFTNLVTSIGAAGAAVFAFNTIFSRIQQGLSDYSALRGVQKTLEAVAGSAQAGGDEFAYISQKSDELGLSLVPTAKAYAGLFAASKEANIAVATTRSVFEGVAGAAKVLNLTAEDTNGVLLALQQIASKGTVASEELRGQIGERLPGAFGLAAKAMGLTTAELGKQLQAGKVLASDFLPKFAAQLKATYGDATADAAQQVGSNLGRINTFFAQSSARLGASFAPLVALLAALVSPSKSLQQVAQFSASAYFRQAEAAKSLTESVTPLLARYDELSGTTSRNTDQQKELDSIIQQLAKSVPGAVTEFDKYGKALGINGDAARKFLAEQRNLTEYNNRTALKDNSADLRRLIAEQEELQKQINNTVTGADGLKRRQVAEASSGGTGGGGSFVRTLSQAESDKITADYSAKLGKVQNDIQANLANRQLLRGYNPLLPTDPTPAQLEGLVEKQEKIIKALKDRQKKTALENQGDGGDFLLGKGGLDEQLKAAEKELDRLLGKVDKAAKGAADRLAAALRALEAARVQLATKAAQAVIKESDDAAARAKLNFDEALRQTTLVEKQLQAREAAVRKAGGRGANADGVIDGVQEKQLAALRVAALDKYYEDLYKITVAREQRLFDLRAESDAKEIEAIDRKYDKQLQVAKDAIERQAVEEARAREQLVLKAAQQQKRIDQTAALGAATAQAVGQEYGAGTGVSVFEAKRAEARALLDIEKKAAEDSLNNTLNKTGKEAEIERQALRAQLGRIKHQQDELSIQETLGKFSIYKLILGENDNDQTRAALDKVASTVVSGLAEITAAEEQAAANRVAVSNQVITELTGQLAAQIQLNAAGSASNIKGLQDQIAAEKQARREALDDQRKAAKEKVLIDTLTQASSITTAAAEVFATFAALGPFGVVAGIAAATLLVGSFVAAKAKAYEAAGNIGQGFYRGGYTGGTDEREERGVVHGKEFVHTAEKTVRYRTLFDALHTDRPEIINWELPQMQALLPKTAVNLLPDVELPEKLRTERADSLRVQHENSFAPMQTRFDRMDERLAAIERSNGRMADRPERLPLGNGKIVEITENGSTHVRELEA